MWTFLGKVFAWIGRGILACFKAGWALVNTVGPLGTFVFGTVAKIGAGALLRSKSKAARLFGWLLTPFETAFGAGITLGLGVYAVRRFFLQPLEPDVSLPLSIWQIAGEGLGGRVW